VITELPHHNMATTFYRLGLSELSDQESRAGVPANPESRTHALLNRARAALYDGRFPAASRFIGEVGSSDDPGNAWLLAEVQFYLGRRQEGERGLQGDSGKGPDRWCHGGAGACLAGEPPGGRWTPQRSRSNAASVDRQPLDGPPCQLPDCDHLRATREPSRGRGSSEPRQPASRATRGSRRIRCLDPAREHRAFRALIEEQRTAWQVQRVRYAPVIRAPL
jgi:hypothetical protein